MYQKMKELLLHTLIPAVLLVMMIPMTAFAAECTASIPVKVEVSGENVPADVTYRLEMEAVTPNAPLPEKVAIEAAKDAEAFFGPIIYTIPEDYEYNVKQTTENKSNFTLDTKVYRVTVRVVNDGKGGLVSEVKAFADGSQDKKADTLLFQNSYSRPSSPGSSGGGGNGGGGGGSSTPPGDGLTIPDNEIPLATIFPDDVPLFGLPKTGDATNLNLWLVLMVISACGLGLSAAVRRRMG